MAFADRHLHHLPHMQSGDLHRQRLGFQAIAVAGMAGAVVLIALHLLAAPGAVGLAVAPFHVGDDPLEDAGHLIDPPTLVIAELDLLTVRAIEEQGFHRLGQVFPLGLAVKTIVFRQGFNRLCEIGRFRFRPRGDGALGDRQVLVGHHEALVKEQLHPQPVAGRTGPERGVEGKEARLDFGDGKARHRAGEVLGIGDPLAFPFIRGRLDNRNPVGKVQRGAETVGQPRLQPLAHDDAVNHHVDVVAELLVQRRRLFKVMELAVHLDPLKALLPKL